MADTMYSFHGLPSENKTSTTMELNHSGNKVDITPGASSAYSSLTYGDSEAAPLNLAPGHFTMNYGADDKYKNPRPTPSTLGWKDSKILENLYKFVVTKGKEPYFELLPTCITTSDFPARIYLDAPRNPTKNEFPCQYPIRCDGQKFKRPADLERHYRNVHASALQMEQLPCDYPLCQRVREPFTRKDHFRDHLRDYHKEDLGCAKGEKIYKREKWLKLQECWIAERKIEARWWRCPKCLIRVQIDKSGFECPDCKLPCDGERAGRINAIRAKVIPAREPLSTRLYQDYIGKDAELLKPYPEEYSACGEHAWTYTEDRGRWDACPTCKPLIQQAWEAGYKAGKDRYDGGSVPWKT